jgi:hypothetical protein
MTDEFQVRNILHELNSESRITSVNLVKYVSHANDTDPPITVLSGATEGGEKLRH